MPTPRSRGTGSRTRSTTSRTRSTGSRTRTTAKKKKKGGGTKKRSAGTGRMWVRNKSGLHPTKNNPKHRDYGKRTGTRG